MVGTCSCHVDTDCGSSHKACDVVSQACACKAGWGGVGCDVPVITSTPCDDGVVDAGGTCCAWFVDAAMGTCCGEGVPVDVSGRCCVRGTVDACGVCGGSGVAVDVLGTCCSTVLPPSGVCCVSGVIDSCGVCGGDNSCM